MESCGVQYEHTFAVVDFGQDPNYELILGRPFMRQLRVIQDWDTDFIYLCHDDVTTRINLLDHTYRDVARTPIDEFDSFSSGLSPNGSTKSEYLDTAWILQEHTDEQLARCAKEMDRLIMDEAYVLVPFPEDVIDAHEWMHILSTIDVCTIPRGTQFCDEDGYDIVPIRMVNLAHYGPHMEEVFHL